MSDLSELTTLQHRIESAIPLAKALDFCLTHYQSGQLSLSAPIETHINDKGTFFAGSQAALFTLAGWALTTLEAELHLASHVDVVAVDNQLKYTAPLTDDITIVVRASEGDLNAFCAGLTRNKRARLLVDAQATGPDGEVIATWSGQYLARA